MVLDASACINMYCNIQRNIMKNQAGSSGFGMQGKISMYMCFMCYALALFIYYVLEFVCRQFLYDSKTYTPPIGMEGIGLFNTYSPMNNLIFWHFLKKFMVPPLATIT